MNTRIKLLAKSIFFISLFFIISDTQTRGFENNSKKDNHEDDRRKTIVKLLGFINQSEDFKSVLEGDLFIPKKFTNDKISKMYKEYFNYISKLLNDKFKYKIYKYGEYSERKLKDYIFFKEDRKNLFIIVFSKDDKNIVKFVLFNKDKIKSMIMMTKGKKVTGWI